MPPRAIGAGEALAARRTAAKGKRGELQDMRLGDEPALIAPVAAGIVGIIARSFLVVLRRGGGEAVGRGAVDQQTFRRQLSIGTLVGIPGEGEGLRGRAADRECRLVRLDKFRPAAGSGSEARCAANRD